MDVHEHHEMEDLSPDDQRIAALLADGWTHARVAEECGISTKTVQRRLRNRAFRRYVMNLKQAKVSEISSRLTGLCDQAIRVQQELLGSDDEKIRYRASKTILDQARRHHREDVEQQRLAQLHELEELVEGLLARLTDVRGGHR